MYRQLNRQAEQLPWVQRYVFLCLALLTTFSAIQAQPLAIQPARIVNAYALTSAYSAEYDDPSDWRLLGSNDDGRSWQLLDVRTNEAFNERSQRRTFAVNNNTAYTTYLLELTNVSFAQVAEFELLGPVVGVTNEAALRANITASKQDAFLGPASQAFDGDPSTRWVDFGTGSNICWIQCQYTRHKETVLTNISQLQIFSRRVTTRNPLLEKAPQVLSNITAQATKPVRVLCGYALTSANDFPERDPRDWRFLGSNDGGKNWDTLDVRRNEIFSTRFQRRTFALTNSACYVLYRLAVESVRIPEGRPGGASCLQIAEIEPLYGPKDPGGKFSIVVSARGENGPMEIADAAFDGDAKTKWLDFAASRSEKLIGANTNKATWIQWQYLRGQDILVINLHWLEMVHSRAPDPVRLQLKGVVVSRNPEVRMLGFLDTSGFRFLTLNEAIASIEPGDEVTVSGTPQFGNKFLNVSEPVLVRLGALPHMAQLRPEQPLDSTEQFATGALEGKVISVAETPFCLNLSLAAQDTPGVVLLKIPNPLEVRLPNFLGCRIRAQGVMQPVLNELGVPVTGILWVSDLEHIELDSTSAGAWLESQEFSIASLAGLKPPVAIGSLVRVTGTVLERRPNGSLLGISITNRFVVESKDTGSVTPGSEIEAIGFFGKEDLLPVVAKARIHPAAKKGDLAQIEESPKLDQTTIATRIHQIPKLARKFPGKSFPVKIRGVITYIRLDLGGFYLQDGDDAVTVAGGLSAAGLSPFLQQEGSFIEVRGEYSPTDRTVIVTPIVQILGRGRMPTPRRHSWDALMTGDDFSHWVEVEGVVREVGDHRLVVAISGGKLIAWINEIDKTSQARLLGSTVKICGVCDPVANNRNTPIGLRLLVPSMENIQIVSPAPENPFALPTRSLAEVMRPFASGRGSRLQFVKTKGIVTYRGPRAIFLQDGDEGIRVFPRADAMLEPGDVVEAVGFSEPDGFSPKMIQAAIRPVGHAALPPATVIDFVESDLAAQDCQRAQVEGIVVGHNQNESFHVLQLQDKRSTTVFSAFIPSKHGDLPWIPIGSQIRITGVLKAGTDSVPDYGQVVTTLDVYCNSPLDVLVMKRPSWWTTGHTFWALTISGVILLLALAWAGLLRRQVLQRTGELREEIAERKRMQVQVEKTHQELVAASRRAGMAEVATGVLHNVGNVLNSVNVCAGLVADRLKNSKSVNLAKAAALMREHEADLPEFLANDSKGRQLPTYLTQLAGHLMNEQVGVLGELQQLTQNIDHIKSIVAMQQGYAKAAGVAELVDPAELMEAALRLNADSLTRHDIQTVREYDRDLPPMLVDKHKVLQILTNLIRNAKYACDESVHANKRLSVQVRKVEGRVALMVSDNGIGISAEHLTRIFSQGFTTRKDGHGFGLHSGALAAKDLGGLLRASSDGQGKGATFTLEVPVISARNK